MNTPHNRLFNPPLRVFGAQPAAAESRSPRSPKSFTRPELQRQVTRDAISRHLRKPRFSATAPLD